jgi:hypothetical protein
MLVPEHDPVYKVSVIPRGRALGVTMFLPEKDSSAPKHFGTVEKKCQIGTAFFFKQT